MPFDTILRGRIAQAPAAVEVEPGDEPATAFIVSDAQTGIYDSEEVPVGALRCCEVVCRGATAVRVLDQLSVGDPVLVYGELKLSGPLDTYNERDLMLVHLQACAIGLDLAAGSRG